MEQEKEFSSNTSDHPSDMVHLLREVQHRVKTASQTDQAMSLLRIIAKTPFQNPIIIRLLIFIK
jgi:hypothetical protein